jgi:hypothetical protein
MAFTFETETGTGSTTATSYVTVAEADDLLSVNTHSYAAWSALSQDVKERLLTWASRILDNRTRWAGRKAVETSALRWPRIGVRDRDGVAIPGNAIPDAVRVATAELARLLMVEDRTAERDQDALKSLKADVVELEFAEGYRLKTIPPHIGYILSGLGTISGGRVRKLVR